MTVTALVLQSWFDIAVQQTGSVMNAYAISFANGGRSVTDEITPGEAIVIPSEIEILKKTVQYLAAKKSIPSTAIQKPPVPPANGIGFMRVGINFKVA